MIQISTNREPVTVQLEGAFESVSLTLRRLTSADFTTATAAALAIIENPSRAEAVMLSHGLVPEGGVEVWRTMATRDPMTYAATLTGVGGWLGEVECAVRAIIDWSGLNDEAGRPAPVTREAVESLMLNAEAAEQVRRQIDKASMLIPPFAAVGTVQ